jgi:CspA family cold shock protein
MGKYRDHRQPRSDRYEKDNGTHSEPDYFQGGSETRATALPTASATSPVSAAEVIWFNAEKGFGFVRLDDGSDAFLHVSKLQAVGQTSLPEGAKLQVLVEVGTKGKPQVSQVVSMESGPQDAVASHLPNPAQRTGEEEGLGSVTRYDAAKGFGFVKLEKGGADVFVHATTLTLNGLTSLNVGQAVLVRYRQGQKGLEARTVRVV